MIKIFDNKPNRGKKIKELCNKCGIEAEHVISIEATDKARKRQISGTKLILLHGENDYAKSMFTLSSLNNIPIVVYTGGNPQKNPEWFESTTGSIFLKKIAIGNELMQHIKKLKGTSYSFNRLPGRIPSKRTTIIQRLAKAFHELRILLGGEERMIPAVKKKQTTKILMQIRKEMDTFKKEKCTEIDSIISQVRKSDLSDKDDRSKLRALITKFEQEVL